MGFDPLDNPDLRSDQIGEKGRADLKAYDFMIFSNIFFMIQIVLRNKIHIDLRLLISFISF